MDNSKDEKIGARKVFDIRKRTYENNRFHRCFCKEKL
jgi:hypothetical protein